MDLYDRLCTKHFIAVQALLNLTFFYSFSLSVASSLSSLFVTGLRKISVSYSRISLSDIASKLHLPSASAAEYICAKAIRWKGRELIILIYYSLSSGESSCCLMPLRNIFTLSHSNLLIQ